MESKYITTKNGFKMIVRKVTFDDFVIEIYESYEKKKSDLLETENYEELIELEKLKHFDFKECLSFWDSFNFELYSKVLEAKNK